MGHREQKQELLPAAEGIANLFSLLTRVLFGAAVIDQALGRLSWQVAIYAVLSLPAIRMICAVAHLLKRLEPPGNPGRFPLMTTLVVK